MKRLVIRYLLSIIFGIGGLIFIASENWKIALGIFFIIWADNISDLED